MRAAFSVSLGAVFLTAAAAAAAHHSFAAEFDINRPVTLTGSVTKIEWTNPHAWLFIDVTQVITSAKPLLLPVFSKYFAAGLAYYHR